MRTIRTLAVVVCLASTIRSAPPALRPAGDFSIAETSGKTHSLANCRGKVVLIEFLYTTCSHCQATARMYNKLSTELGAQGFEVLGVAFNTEAQGNASVVDEFVKANQIRFPVGSAPFQSVLDYLGLSVMKRFVVPQIVIVDRNGMIRAQSDAAGTPELQDETYVRSLVEQLLKEPPAVR
jgi:peroxiredoxin